MKTHNIDCDNCGDILRGRKGTTFVERDHLAFKGAFTIQTTDEVGQPDHFYVTQNPEEMHHFCDFMCLQAFADFRRHRYEEIKRKQRVADARQATNE